MSLQCAEVDTWTPLWPAGCLDSCLGALLNMSRIRIDCRGGQAEEGQGGAPAPQGCTTRQAAAGRASAGQCQCWSFVRPTC